MQTLPFPETNPNARQTFTMIAALDVHYEADNASAGMVVFQNWHTAVPFEQHRHEAQDCAPYQPGQFYKRELPVLLQTIRLADQPIETVVVDGYVDLGEGRPGLGRHLFDALGGKVRVIGVAKSEFEDNDVTLELFRGQSARPLFITAAGYQVALAKLLIESMHGQHRIPTLLKLVDSIARGR
ncbi:MAG: endonuclease V [Planctomycetota bacterium]